VQVRARSSVGVVLVGLLPLVVGGPIFAAVLAVLCVLAFREYLSLVVRLSPSSIAPITGSMAIAALAGVALRDDGARVALSILAIVSWIPLIAALRSSPLTDGSALAGWALATSGIVYLGVPAFAGVALRRIHGAVDAEWLTPLAQFASPGWDNAPRGLAWVLVILLAAWLGDTFAYLVGRTWGHRKLAPRVSPGKTIEGAAGGLVGSAIMGAIGMAVFGLGVSPVWGAVIGLVLGVVGQTGDLAESLIKRQVGAKDSGTLIPGHGGVLDRIDTLLFTLPAGWLLAIAVDRWIA